MKSSSKQPGGADSKKSKKSKKKQQSDRSSKKIIKENTGIKKNIINSRQDTKLSHKHTDSSNTHLSSQNNTSLLRTTTKNSISTKHKQKLSKNTFEHSKRKERLQDSNASLKKTTKATLSKSFNRTKRLDKGSFDSDFMNSSQSIANSTSLISNFPIMSNKLGTDPNLKFGESQHLNTECLEDSIDFQKSKSKCFVYKRSRIDRLVSHNIAKNKNKEEKATLKRIKEVEEKINKREEISRLNQQVRLKNVIKSKKSLNWNKGQERDHEQSKTIKVKSTSKSSIHNPRAWREFFEVKKEVDNMDDKLFLSTDSALNNKINGIQKSGLIKKSGSVDGGQSPSLIHELLNNPDESFCNRKLKIKSNKDLNSLNVSKPKYHCSKSKGPQKKIYKKLGDKMCLEELGNKTNIKKYMKKKRKKLVKEDIKIKICDNLRALNKFTRQQRKRMGAFKDRSASAQHRLYTGRQNNQYVFDPESNSLVKTSKGSKVISTRKLSSLYPNDLHIHIKKLRQK